MQTRKESKGTQPIKFKGNQNPKGHLSPPETKTKELSLSSISKEKCSPSQSGTYSMSSSRLKAKESPSSKGWSGGSLVMKPKMVRVKEKQFISMEVSHLSKIQCSLRQLLSEVTHILQQIRNYVTVELGETISKITTLQPSPLSCKPTPTENSETTQSIRQMSQKLEENPIESAISNYLESIKVISQKLKKRKLMGEQQEERQPPEQRSLKLNKLKISASLDDGY